MFGQKTKRVADTGSCTETLLKQILANANDENVMLAEVIVTRFVRRVRICFAAQASFALLFLIVQGLESWRVISERASEVISICLCAATVATVVYTKTARRDALKLLKGSSGCNEIGPICDLIVDAKIGKRTGRCWKPVLIELIRLLPGTTAAECQQLSPSRVKALVKALDSQVPEFALAALPVIGRTAASETLPTITVLAAGRGAATGRADIQEAARICLANIEERCAAMNNKDTLLRVAVPGSEDCTQLLREGIVVSDTLKT